MSKFGSPLNNIKVASPCSANWDEMYGDNRKRFCGDCKLNVYNLSGMSREAAENLIQGSESRLCVRFCSRPDGTIITEDCPVGWAKIKQRTNVFATAVMSMLIALFGGLFFVSVASRMKGQVGVLRNPFASPTPQYPPTMGAVAMPSPTPTPKVTPTPRPGQDVNEMVGKIAAQPRRPRD